MSTDKIAKSTRVCGSFWGILLVGAGLVLLMLGLWDVFGGETIYGVRLRAALMVIAAMYILWGACTLLFRLWEDKYATATEGVITLSAALAAAVCGGLLIAYQFVNGDLTLSLLLWVAILVAGICTGVFLMRNGARIPYPKTQAIAAIVSGLLAVANFAYTSLYQPTAEPVQLGFDVAIGKPTIFPDRKRASVPFTVSVANTGKVAVTVVMSTYSLLGRNGKFRESDSTPEELNLAASHGQPASLRTSNQGYAVVQTDRFVFEGTEIPPGEKVRAERTAYVTLGTYDAIALNAWILVLRTDEARLSRSDISLLSAVSWCPNKKETWCPKEGEMWVPKENIPPATPVPGYAASDGVPWIRHDVPIEETSTLKSMIRDKWKGYVWLVARDPAPGRPPGSYISYNFTPEDRPDQDRIMAVNYNETAHERYGLRISVTGLYEKSALELGLDP